MLLPLALLSVPTALVNVEEASVFACGESSCSFHIDLVAHVLSLSISQRKLKN